MCFFRVYEDGKPVKPQHYLKWSPAGSKDGELVFVSGHPGRTNRQNTLAELEYLRDVAATRAQLAPARTGWRCCSGRGRQRSEENARRAKEDFFGVQNSRKARVGGLAGLLDPKLMARKAAEEKRLPASSSSKHGGTRRRPRRPGQIAEGREDPGRDRPRRQPARGRAGVQQPPVRHRPAPCCGPPRSCPSRPASGSASTATPGSTRSSSQLFSDEPIYDDCEIAEAGRLARPTWPPSSGPTATVVKKVLAGKSPRGAGLRAGRAGPS